MSSNSREAILAAARATAQAHGYGGLNFRDIAATVGIKSASIHYHFPTKADLGAAVARKYWEDTEAELDRLTATTPDASMRLRRYPGIFRRALENGNRMCLCSIMAAGYDDLPETVKREVQQFTDVNVRWLSRTLAESNFIASATFEDRARAIFAAVSGAQLFARGKADVAVFDSLIAGFQEAGLLPA